MKILTNQLTISLFLLILLLFHGCTNSKDEKLVFPYSQWTVGEGTSNISWHFLEGFEYNNSFIKAPADGEWDDWYGKITTYREAVLEKACGTCIDECPVEAISEGDIYKIDPDVCTDCGACADVCPVEAIHPA
jgi:ferredoxin